MQYIPSDHSGIKLETRNIKIAEKSPNSWKLNNTPLNNTWVKAQSQIKKKYYEYMKIKMQPIHIYGFNKSITLRKIYSTECIY